MKAWNFYYNNKLNYHWTPINLVACTLKKIDHNELFQTWYNGDKMAAAGTKVWAKG